MENSRLSLFNHVEVSKPWGSYCGKWKDIFQICYLVITPTNNEFCVSVTQAVAGFNSSFCGLNRAQDCIHTTAWHWKGAKYLNCVLNCKQIASVVLLHLIFHCDSFLAKDTICWPKVQKMRKWKLSCFADDVLWLIAVRATLCLLWFLLTNSC